MRKVAGCYINSFHIHCHQQHSSALPPAASLPKHAGQIPRHSSARLKPLSQCLMNLSLNRFPFKLFWFSRLISLARCFRRASLWLEAGRTTLRACASMRHTFVYFNPHALFRPFKCFTFNQVCAWLNSFNKTHTEIERTLKTLHRH